METDNIFENGLGLSPLERDYLESQILRCIPYIKRISLRVKYNIFSRIYMEQNRIYLRLRYIKKLCNKDELIVLEFCINYQDIDILFSELREKYYG